MPDGSVPGWHIPPDLPDSWSNVGSDEISDAEEADDLAEEAAQAGDHHSQLVVAETLPATASEDWYEWVVPAEAADPSPFNGQKPTRTFDAKTLAELDADVTRVRQIHNRVTTERAATNDRRVRDMLQIITAHEDEEAQRYIYYYGVGVDHLPPPGEGVNQEEDIPDEPSVAVPTYAEALTQLQAARHHLTERTFLLHWGPRPQVELILGALDLPLTTRLVLMENWDARRTRVLELMTLGLPMDLAHDPVPSAPLAPQAPKRPPPPSATRRRNQYQRIIIASSCTGRETPLERARKEYQDLIRHIILEVREFTEELNLPCFGLLKKDASATDTARVYGQPISARKGGGRVEMSGLKQRWSRLNRFFQAATHAPEDDQGHRVNPLWVCEFIDRTKYQGVSALLKWAGRALGIEHFTYLGSHDVLDGRQPGDGFTTHVEGPRATKHAPWLPDEFVRFLADCCHHSDPIIRRKALFLYICAVGGVRYTDAQHVTEIKIIGVGQAAMIHCTASRFKATRRNIAEVFALPLVDYKGRSLHCAVQDLKAQMRQGFLLAAAKDAGDVFSDLDERVRKCSYHESTRLIREFLRLWSRVTHMEEFAAMDFSKCTIHSFKGWLDTLCRQARVAEDDTDTILHWCRKKMSVRYDRNPALTEIFLRQRLVALLASDWRSKGEGLQQVPLAAYGLSFETIRPVEIQEDNQQTFYF